VSTNNITGGKCAGRSDNGFEPADKHKGQLAWAMFYVSTAYFGLIDCCTNDNIGKSNINIKPPLEQVRNN
jgi:hypothetical protein